MKIRISRPKFIMCFLFLGLVVLVRYAMRDMELDIDILRESIANLPGMVMQNIQMTRELSGDTWRIKIPYLDRDGDIMHVSSLDIHRHISGDKGDWHFFGHSGIFSYDQMAASIQGVSGTLSDERRAWRLEGSRLDWQETNNTFTFPEGLIVYDSEFSLNTPLASMDNSGVILLDHGGVIQWLRPLRR